LRERRDDIPLLSRYFLDAFCSREGRESKRIVPEAMEAFKRYEWPGNVRELKNIVERLVIMTPGGTVTVDHLPDYFRGDGAGKDAGGGKLDSVLELSSLREAREEFEREFIIQKLEENDWNVSKTAEAIELERSNLHRKIKSYGIDMKK
jgi:two-component system nitrogen regulation response regulator NtrX